MTRMLFTFFACVAVAIITASTGCTSDKEFIEKARDAMKRHNELASQPTPIEWHPGAVWRFVTIPRAGKLQPEDLTLLVTDEPGVSCLGGDGWKDDWRKFVLLEGHVRFGPPVYQVEGRALEINLSADMCDAYDVIDGAFVGSEFIGERTKSGWGAATDVIGTVRGSCVQGGENSPKE